MQPGSAWVGGIILRSTPATRSSSPGLATHVTASTYAIRSSSFGIFASRPAKSVTMSSKCSAVDAKVKYPGSEVGVSRRSHNWRHDEHEEEAREGGQRPGRGVLQQLDQPVGGPGDADR